MSTNGQSRLAGISYHRRELDVARFVDSHTDAAVARVVTQVLAADSAAQQSIRNSLDESDLYTVRAFSQRRAVSALRTNGVDLATQGILALALIDYTRIDFRDLSVDLPHCALHKVGGDAQAVLQRGAAISEPGTARLFALAKGRADEPRSLSECLKLPVTSRYGFGLMDTRSRTFETTVALPARGIEIADIVDDTTPYETVSLVADTELPPVWLEGPHTPARTKAAADAVRACVSITAEMNGVEFLNPGLLIFLAEASDSSRARELADLARTHQGPGQRQTAISHGDLVLVVIASSFRWGGTTPETESSLKAIVDSLTMTVKDDRLRALPTGHPTTDGASG